MPRSQAFHAGRTPLQDQRVPLESPRISGPLAFCNPTQALFQWSTRPHFDRENVPTPRIERLWRSRDNRKGRHALKIHQRPPGVEGKKYPRKTVHPYAILEGILLMFTTFPYWDISFWVAFTFTVGSMIWVINSFFVWLPSEDPSTEFPHEVLTAGGVTAFIGATVFEIGSVLLLLEAVNENQTGCFGWAVETASKEAEEQVEEAVVRIKSDVESCLHHHANRRSFLTPSEARQDSSRRTSAGQKRSFEWLPTLTELRTHYLHEIGFWASLVQFIGATIFWIAGFTGLPGIINHISQAVTNGVYWVPQIVGGSCFIMSGLLFTLETQPKWYIPAINVLGWHVGFWNSVGGVGFTLCGAFGPATSNSGLKYQSSLSTFWGSWAFLLGSLIQWYESLDKHPVEEKK
ncbi:uncharacterized protein CDV56_104968 [Aspergillus thermomutatus]|uniref:Integral membrane protein n=1 Tax=Aspergillus thermomutatus TaxID=41047 RepID=A0A397H4S1_ASPTH|nr:uncharacterized protein CDV56_104968 [Aspergillus thermomutatus]RHZ55410.1 hypothetical protein CDV56_104968 [Aspergillus thermomutatus]